MIDDRRLMNGRGGGEMMIDDRRMMNGGGVRPGRGSFVTVNEFFRMEFMPCAIFNR
jgi:hypothetical protein